MLLPSVTHGTVQGTYQVRIYKPRDSEYEQLSVRRDNLSHKASTTRGAVGHPSTPTSTPRSRLLAEVCQS